MSGKLRGSRLEAEVDRCRSECDWKRLEEVLPFVRAKNSGMEQVGDLLEAELIIETFVEQHSGYLLPKKENATELAKAEVLLKNVLASTAAEKPNVNLEANLLLAKVHHYSADYPAALADIEHSRVERVQTQFSTLRILRLVAEAYAIKGFAVEKSIAKENKANAEKIRMRALYCFEKSAELAIFYVQELEKSIGSSSRHVSTLLSNVSLGGSPSGRQSDRMGDLLESTLERVPVLRLRHNVCDKPWDSEGVEWYRRIMTSLGDKIVGEKLQQRLSRQLAEVLIRGMPESDYTASLSVNKKSQSLGFYTGSHRGYFAPSSRMEEILLLLLISEALASKDVILSRSDDMSVSRHQSLQNAKSVHNLLTLVLSNLRQYEVLATIYEKAMKFANQDRYIWLQFALTLICHGRWVRASRILSQCIACEINNENAAVQHLLAAQLEMEKLGQYDKALTHAKKAVDLCKGHWLEGRCRLVYDVAFSLKAQSEMRYEERRKLFKKSVQLFEETVKLDPHDDLANFYCALQYAIVRDYKNSREWCEKSLELNPELVPSIMLLALIFTVKQDYKAALELTCDAIGEFPSNYGLLVLKLKLESKFGRINEALTTCEELLHFWRNSDPYYFLGSTESQVSIPSKGSTTLFDSRSSVAHLIANREAVAPLFVAPIGMLSAPSISSTAVNSSFADLTDAASTLGNTVTNASDIVGGATSTISEGVGSASSATRPMYAAYRLQANIWLELAELYLEFNRVSEVRSCVEEACSLFPNSHQALYLKARLLAVRADSSNDLRVKEKFRTEAKASLLGALAILPSHIPSLRQLALIYWSESNIRMAEKLLRDVVRVDPLHPDQWQLLGSVLAEDGRQDEAISCFTTASALQLTTPLIPFEAIPTSLRL
ncbi:hypothetical protein AB6A40_001950 [Gnathostoma spinigerum]|uniref:Tetratricopeptide repeat protein 7 N-terminal domain-containing protein n=1 Tax=Gnathostoma spinigerum TaxID=75299 RepID=A0ABD6E7U6_9BILA